MAGRDWGNPLERVSRQLDPGGVLVLIDGDHRFVLGKCSGAVVDHGYTPAIDPERDATRFHGRLRVHCIVREPRRQ